DGLLVSASVATYNGGKVNTLINPPDELPDEFALYQNYPNPFNNTTVITFDLPHDDNVEIEIINSLGQVVYWQHKRYTVGQNQIEWDGRDNAGSPVASGVYYYRLSTTDHSESKKMMLLK
ncbi:MAG: T9SS type A sorting domain-containing protein, partial [Candidatus Zixiibacteriota bacterium]